MPFSPAGAQLEAVSNRKAAWSVSRCTRPLVLDEHGVVEEAVAGLVRSHPLRQLIRHAVVEPVADLPADVGRVPVRHVAGLVAPLHVVAAGDVGHRAPPGGVFLVARRRRIEAAIDEVGERHAGAGGLLGDGNEVRQHAVGSWVAVVGIERRIAGLEEQAIRERRRPRRLHDLRGRVPDGARLGRHRGRARRHARARRHPAVAGSRGTDRRLPCRRRRCSSSCSRCRTRTCSSAWPAR